MKVKDIMTRNPDVAKVPGTRREVLKKLISTKRTGLPVVDSKGKLVGLITRRDIFNHPKEEQLAMLMNWEPPTIAQSETVRKAAQTMLKHNIIYHLPVLDSHKKLVGVIAPCDLLSIIEQKKMKKPVGEYITKTCVPVYKDTPIKVCADIIDITKSYALPVLNEEGKLIGLITDRDLFNLSYIEEKIALSELGLGNDEDTWTWEGLRNVIKVYYQETKIDLPNIPVNEVMIKDPLSVLNKTPVCDAAKDMRKNDFGQLPVRDVKDKLISLVYDIDLLTALLEK
jgi:CBS domain-containing protein